MRYSYLIAAGLLAIVGMASAANDPYNGLWKIDDSKSGWSDGNFPKNMSLSIQLKVTGDEIVYHSINDTNKEKKANTVDYTAKADGKDNPLTGGGRYNMVSIRRVSKDEYEVLEKKDGDVIVFAIWQMLPGNKTFVRRGMAKGVDGKAHEYEEFFNKQ